MTTEVRPPDFAFENPNFDGPHAIEITTLAASGTGKPYSLIRGHAALFASCHLSFPGACVTPPREAEHTYYRLGEVVTASGNRVAVGTIAMDTGHAPVDGIDPRKAAQHYDDTGTSAALVASGEDEWGLWVAGIANPQLDPVKLALLAGAKLSGDWRRIAGKLRLVAMLAVNTPGFPVPRLRTSMVAGAQMALVASGVVPDEAYFERQRTAVALSTLRASARLRMGRDTATLRAQLRGKVHGG